ncbi:MAG: hypothetical protein QF570_17600 [Myxococcota bacterium]|nr:hypothetical protein [Myxococcota bacterium]
MAQFRGHIFHRAMWGILGSADFYMGLLNATLGQFDEALSSFDTAMKQSVSLGARAWPAENHLAQAQLYVRRGEADDSSRAFSQAGMAFELASELGQAGVLTRAGSMLGEIEL